MATYTGLATYMYLLVNQRYTMVVESLYMYINMALYTAYQSTGTSVIVLSVVV